MNGLAIEVQGLTKRFGERTALAGIDLAVPRNSAFGFLGPNGAGKTTLIRLLLGLTRPDGGAMRLLGHALPDGRSAALGRIGAIVEEPRFHPFLTGRENLEVVAAAREPEAHARIDGALARVGLSGRERDRVGGYSLGMRQRLGIARTLLGDPQLLILDEPMNGLDPAGMHEFRELIGEFVEEGRTVLLSSHLLDEVEKVCDAVAIVDRGAVVVQGRLADLRAGAEEWISIATNDDGAAVAFARGSPGVERAEHVDGGIRVTLRADVELEAAAAQLTSGLIQAGVAVHRFEPRRASLEERFLEITSRLGAEQ